MFLAPYVCARMVEIYLYFMNLIILSVTEFEGQFMDQDKDLINIENAMNELKKKMETIYEEIRTRSERYQNCVQ